MFNPFRVETNPNGGTSNSNTTDFIGGYLKDSKN
jgi:hypothetical protein